MTRKSAKGAADRSEMVQWLFDNSHDLTQVVAPDGRFLHVNRAWLEFTGLTERELLGKSILDFCHPDEIEEIRVRAAQDKPGAFSEHEVRLKARDGSWRWMAARRQVMGDGAFIGNMRDITAEHDYREEIAEAQRTRKALGAAAGIGVWEYDPLTERIWWSDEIAAVAGFDTSLDWTAERFLAHVHPGDRRRTEAVMSDAVETGQPRRLEHRVRAHGVWITLRVTVQTEATSHGVFRLKGISEDITELAEARDAARRGEQKARKARREVAAFAGRLNMALEAAEAGVYEIDHVKKTFWCSPEFERITGRKNSSYAEATELRYPGFHADDLDHVRASFRALHRGSKKSGECFEARIIRPDGTERWVRVFHHLKVSKGGRWLKAVGLVQDCDATKRQELALKEAQRAAEAAAEAKSAFLANMSHEIRTPMNGVMGVLHLLSAERLSDDGRALLAEAVSCGQMLSELLNDVIDFSKIEAGHLELAAEPLNPCDLMRGVARLLEPQARAKGLQLIVDGDTAAGWMLLDPVRLRQALFNLIGNAVKFTEKGHVVVRCRRPEPGLLRFEVEDTGVGIPAEAQDRVFERFNQGDASTTRRFGGSGLGLSITRKLAELMQGEVGFQSAEGRGSTFWMEVRAPPADAPAPGVEPTEALLAGVRILVVEDNPTNRLIATKLLENLGADVETASDGYLGVDAATQGGFDLILMDIQMPGIDGVEAARRIRALGGAAAATPIVALTANVLAHQRQSYIDAGMDGVVGKPIAPAALLGEISAAVQRREAAMGETAAA